MKYIVFSNKTKKIVLPPSNKPYTDLTKYVTQCEVEQVPSKYDYLMADNVQEQTRVIREAYIEKVFVWNEETQQEEIKLVEHPQVTETYYTCDLIAKFYEYTAEQLEKIKHEKYKTLAKKYIRQIYDIDEEFAIHRKKDIEPEKYNKYNNDIEECLAKAHLEVYGY